MAITPMEGSSVDEMQFESTDTPTTSTDRSPEEMAKINETLGALDPKDILQYLVEAGKLPEETQLIEPGEEELPEEGAENITGAAGDMMGLEGLSFEGM